MVELFAGVASADAALTEQQGKVLSLWPFRTAKADSRKEATPTFFSEDVLHSNSS